jgi:hypothetical protein
MAFAMWNDGLAFAVGILLHQIARRRWLTRNYEGLSRTRKVARLREVVFGSDG